MDMDMDMVIFLLFRFFSDGLWVFRLYRNTETSCFDIKTTQPLDSAETSFGFSFGYIKTKLVS
jgi:hypothetical protein